MYFKILFLGWFLIIIQGVTSYYDGYLYQTQMNSLGIYGWAFVEHSGMWADFIIVSPVVAFIMSRYSLPYFSKRGLIMLVFTTVLIVFAGYQYQQMSFVAHGADIHDGYVTVAGWIHSLYAIVTMWVIGLFFISPFDVKTRMNHLVVIASLLTIWAILGVVKFNPEWMWSKVSIIQVAVEICLIWTVTGARIWLQL